ncbi:MAG: SUMF1/EgtB/PvdO family nonheme iron enzyme, partial [Planctomycetales bacterium]|nr:SUMF1/EgtB/PvdO family nonheme iron enzyme [Planctomycetales bacterium]
FAHPDGANDRAETAALVKLKWVTASGVVTDQTISSLTFSRNDAVDWYVIPSPLAVNAYGDFSKSRLSSGNVDVADEAGNRLPFLLFAGRDLGSDGQQRIVPVETYNGVPDYYLIQVDNPNVGSAKEFGYQIDLRHVGTTTLVDATKPDGLISDLSGNATPTMIPLGDIDGDGWEDFISSVRSEAADYLATITFGAAADLTPTSPRQFVLRLPENPLLESRQVTRALITHGDFNGDSIQDIVVGLSEPVSDRVKILYGRPDAFALLSKKIIPNVLSEGDFYLRLDSQDWQRVSIQHDTFDPTQDIDAASDSIRLGQHDLQTGDRVYLTAGIIGSSVAGLTVGDSYYVIVDQDDPTRIQLAVSLVDANSIPPVPIDLASGSGQIKLALETVTSLNRALNASGFPATAREVSVSTSGSAVENRLMLQMQTGTSLQISYFDPDLSLYITARTPLGEDLGFTEGQMNAWHLGEASFTATSKLDSIPFDGSLMVDPSAGRLTSLASAEIISNTGSRGWVEFGQADYQIGDTATIRLRDRDLAGIGSVDVVVTSSSGDSETLTLSETISGAFSGSIPIAASGVAGDNTLNTSLGDVLSVIYSDANDGSGNPLVISDDAQVVLNLLSNGSFENGGFSEWTQAISGNPFRPWSVSNAGSGGSFGLTTTTPVDGTFDVWNGFDGSSSGGTEFTLFRDLDLPTESQVVLSWQDRVQWNFTVNVNLATLPRTHNVELLDPATNEVLATLYSFTTGIYTTNPTGDTGWLQHNVDLSSYAGTTVRLMFRQSIPEVSTGPGQLEIDAVKLHVTPDDRTFDAQGSDALALGFPDAGEGRGGVQVFVGDPRGAFGESLYQTDFTSATGQAFLPGWDLVSTGQGVSWSVSDRAGNHDDKALVFANPLTGTYSGISSGSAVSPEIDFTSVDLQTPFTIQFDYLLDVEAFAESDRASLWVIDATDLNQRTLLREKQIDPAQTGDDQLVVSNSWRTLLLDAKDLIADGSQSLVELLAGKRVRLSFEFDSVDDIANETAGFAIDRLRVETSDNFRTEMTHQLDGATADSRFGLDVVGIDSSDDQDTPGFAILASGSSQTPGSIAVYSVWPSDAPFYSINHSESLGDYQLMALGNVAGSGRTELGLSLSADFVESSIPWLDVGVPGNAADSLTGYGSVDYAYRMSRLETTNREYVEFLNAVDPAGINARQLYNPLMKSDARGGISKTSLTGVRAGTHYSVKTGMAEMPVNFVSLYDAMRFANWVYNGKGTGSTETGAYELLGGGPTPTNSASIVRSSNATIFLPSENEWYKAAYYRNTGAEAVDVGVYHEFPTARGATPVSVEVDAISGAVANPGVSIVNFGSTADWNGVNGNVIAVGISGSLSQFNISDLAGNVSEWIEDPSGVLRGGGASSNLDDLRSTFRNDSISPTTESAYQGIRLASIDTHGTLLLNLDGVSLGQSVGLAAVSTMFADVERFYPLGNIDSSGQLDGYDDLGYLHLVTSDNFDGARQFHAVGSILFGSTELGESDLLQPDLNIEFAPTSYRAIPGDVDARFTALRFSSSNRDLLIRSEGATGEIVVIHGQPLSAQFELSGETLRANPYRYTLATPAANQPNVVTVSPSAWTLENAVAIDGGLAGNQVENLRSIGDVNGDGKSDYFVGGRSVSYVLYGPLDASNTLVDLNDRADIVIEHGLPGSPGYLGTPFSNFGDFDGDGKIDLGLYRQQSGNVAITIVYGAALLPRNSRFLFDSTAPNPSGFRVEHGQFDFDELAIDAGFVDWDGASQPGEQLFLTGVTKTVGLDFYNGLSGGYDELLISHGGANAFGDLDGDGFEDLTFKSSVEIVTARFDDRFNERGTLSDDGRFIAFQSNDSALLSSFGSNADYAIFVKDLQSGQITYVSRRNGASGTLLNSSSNVPAISGNGRYVGFTTNADNLVDINNGDSNNYVYRRDLANDVLELVSRQSDVNGGNVANNFNHEMRDISDDGNIILFASDATNLGVPSGGTNLYVRDMNAGQTEVVALGINYGSLSGDGRYVVYSPPAGGLFLYDRNTDSAITILPTGNFVSSLEAGPDVSADGRFVVFQSDSPALVNGDDNGVKDVFVFDRSLGTTERASEDQFGRASNRPSTTVGISDDGRYVAFLNDDDQFFALSAAGSTNVFIKDRATGTVTPVSIKPDGTPSNDSAAMAILSGDGRSVSFISRATDLSEQSFGTLNLFVAPAASEIYYLPGGSYSAEPFGHSRHDRLTSIGNVGDDGQDDYILSHTDPSFVSDTRLDLVVDGT